MLKNHIIAIYEIPSSSLTIKLFDDQYSKIISKIDKVLERISHRVFYDFCVNGFLANENVFNYGTRIEKRPEFLMTLSELLPNAKKIENYWIDHSKSYRINFYAKKN